jgi:DNA-binding response OmpR family regulator
MVIPKPRILVVDDEEHVREVLARMLDRYGYDCVAVSSPSAASYRLERETFDAAILDVVMPEKSGIELLREIRAGGADIAVIILTAFAGTITKADALAAGADDVLPKPTSFDDLHSRLQVAMERRRRQSN